MFSSESSSSTSKLSRQRKPIDYACIALPLLPIAALAGVMVWAAISWQVNSRRLEQMQSEAFENMHPNTLIATRYDREHDKTHSEELRDIGAAATMIFQAAPLDIPKPIDLVPFDNSTPKEYFDEAATQGHAIIHRYKPIADSGSQTWFPIVFAGAHDRQIEHRWSDGLLQLLRCECIDAIHDNEKQRAIDALALMVNFKTLGSQIPSRFSNARDWRIASCAIVNETLRHDLWNEDELKKLEQLFKKPTDLDEDWRRYVTNEMLMASQLIGDEDVPGDKYNMNKMRTLNASVIAPTERIEFMEIMQMAASSGGINSLVKPESRKEAYDHMVRTGQPPPKAPIYRRTGADRLLKMSTNPRLTLRNVLSLQHGLASHLLFNDERSREQTRLGLAIKRFKLLRDRFPEKLTELAEIGVEPAQYAMQYSQNRHYASLTWHQEVPVTRIWAITILPGSAEKVSAEPE